ncbi:ABC transporter permease [Leifsonia sp. C5G2]|uniref:ABC transporter permease n=1 Tax=Leifsonia sp. C5G2 TaxID=2735269 RepID=UPI0015848025|nr:ABC transporter permease [Leifsonia sp. C5G2]NUU05859.1 ABC transporter permease [Leifsonia sp. C5G2]
MSAPTALAPEPPALETPPAVARVHTPWRRTVGLALGAGLAVVVILLAFLWPTVTSSVKDLPIAVTGSPAAVSAVTAQLNKSAEGALALTTASSRADAVKLIENRTVDGAIVLGERPEVLTASANGAAVSQLLGQLAAKLQAQAQQQADAAVQQAVAAGKAPAGTVAPKITVAVTDVVPLASTDARGLGLTASSFPLVLGGMIGGVLISILVAGSWRRLTAVAVYAVAGGLAVTGIMQGWFGILQGAFWANWLAVSLSMLATSAFIVGMNALLGRAGIAVGAVVTVLIGNPLSSAAQPLQFVAAPWGEIGQWFVPGASVTLLRDLSYFPAADALFPWLVLLGWAAVGVVAMLAGHFRDQEVSEAAA